MLNELSRDIATSISSTLERFVDPSQRVFWPFLIGTGLLAFVVLLAKKERLGTFFSKELWTHRSARMDYRLLFANAAVKALLGGALTLGTLGVIVAVDGGLSSLFGAHGDSGAVPTWLVVGLYTLALFLVLDYSRYLVHRLMHRVPALWHFHQVHHSAEVLTPITVYRIHPVESVLYGLRGSLATGLVTGVFWYFFKGRSIEAELLGVNALGFVFSAAGSNLRHSHVYLSYGWLESFLISPAQHQLHHSEDPRHYDCNYGAFLAVWDRIGSSLQFGSEANRPTAFGLKESERNHEPDSVLSAYVGPFAALGTELVDRTRALNPAPATSLLAITAMQCTPADSGEPPPELPDFDRSAMLQNLADNVIVPGYQAALDEAGTLESAIASYCDALGSENEATTLAEARASFGLAMHAWQMAELTSIGPAHPLDLALRDNVYSWPVISGCAVDQDIMLSLAGDYDISARLVNRRGLDALEYLLFNEKEASECPSQSVPEGWDEMALDDKKAARCEFAKLAVADLQVQQQAIIDAWSSGYRDDFATAGQADSSYELDQDAVNEVYEGLFYLELKTKDHKLGGAVGKTDNDCSVVDAPCADMLESPFALQSKEYVLGNLDGFEQVFNGGQGLGFDDYLVAAGAEPLALQIQSDLDAVRATVEGMPTTMREQLEGDYSAIETAYDQLRTLTLRLKDDVPPVLLVDVPQEAGGDAD